MARKVNQETNETTGLDHEGAEKRPYRSPVLSEYGSIEDLVDAGVIAGGVTTVPSSLPIL
jgi:hypothetical protein